MTKPIGLQLSRRKGFNLDALSRAFNGLEAVNVARPGPWGNCFIVNDKYPTGRVFRGAIHRYYCVPTIEDAIECHRLMMTTEPQETEPGTRAHWLRNHLHLLRGKNLACWCALPRVAGEPDLCHRATLLELANR